MAALSAPLVPLRAAAQADGAARYRLEATFAWTAETHPEGFPDAPHFSELIGVVHRRPYRLFADGETASSGLALVATNGRTSVLETELEEARRRGRVAAVFFGGRLAAGVGTLSAEFDVSAEHRLASFATMLAPSPDWFAGVASVDLAPDGAWLDRVERPIWVWDAGADSGLDYASPNEETQPRESVRLLTAPAFLGDDGLRRVGAAVFLRID